MRRLTLKEIENARNEKQSIKITYQSEYSKGVLILKTSIYNIRQKDIFRRLKDCTYSLEVI